MSLRDFAAPTEIQTAFRTPKITISEARDKKRELCIHFYEIQTFVVVFVVFESTMQASVS